MANWYEAGTVSVNNGSDTITGAGGTAWLANVRVGDLFTVDNDNFYMVSGVSADDTLTIKPNFGQANVSGASYAIAQLSVTNAQLSADLADLLAKWHVRENELVDWLTGTVDGGPNSNGRYPLTDLEGNTVFVECPAWVTQVLGDPAFTTAQDIIDSVADAPQEAEDWASKTDGPVPWNPELSTNGGFATWTADDPDSWTREGTEDASNYINEAAGGGAAHFVSAGTLVSIKQDMSLTPGTVYRLGYDFGTVTSGSITFKSLDGITTYAASVSATGSVTFTATDAGLLIETSAADLILGKVSVMLAEYSSKKFATDAAASALTAEGHKDDAQAAQSATEGARDLTLGYRDTTLAYRDGAIAAQTASEAARDLSQSYRDTAEIHKNDSEAAKTASEAARDLTLGYRDTAETHKNDAQAAQTAAETARDNILAGIEGTSTTSFTPALGALTITIETGKNLSESQPIVVGKNGQGSSVYVQGRIDTYNPGTGQLDLDIDTAVDTLASGPYNDWVVNIGGAPGAKGDTGDAGTAGWSPILAIVTDGQRKVQQVIDWTGGGGSKPTTGQYVGPSGLVADIASAQNIITDDSADFTHQTASFVIADSGVHDQGSYNVDATAGVIEISFDGGYVPVDGDYFCILDGNDTFDLNDVRLMLDQTQFYDPSSGTFDYILLDFKEATGIRCISYFFVFEDGLWRKF